MSGPETSTRESTDGIYCLGNDRVAEWLGPFLASLRAQEPSIPVYLIPFDDRISEFARLAREYDAEIYEDPILTELDDLGRQAWPTREASSRMFRKLAVFEGPLERFLFLDADVVVLEPVGRLIADFADCGTDFVYFDSDMNFVYRPGEFRDRMERDFDAHGFSAGSFLTSRAKLERDTLVRLVEEATAYRAEFPSGVGDQPVLNYCVDVGGLSKGRASDVLPGVPYTCFVGAPDLDVVAGPRVRSQHAEGWLPFLHWAGQKIGPRMPHRDLFKHFRDLHRGRYGRSPVRRTWRRFMPQR
jgi:hypothetical protein